MYDMITWVSRKASLSLGLHLEQVREYGGDDSAGFIRERGGVDGHGGEL